MKSYDLFKEWEKLSPEQQRYAVGYFLGGVGMHYEGFTNGHRNKPHAEYVVKEFESAIGKAFKDRQETIGIRTGEMPKGVQDEIEKTINKYLGVIQYGALDPLVKMFDGKSYLKFSEIYAPERFPGLSKSAVRDLLEKDPRFEYSGDWNDSIEDTVRLIRECE